MITDPKVIEQTLRECRSFASFFIETLFIRISLGDCESKRRDSERRR